MLVMHRGLIPVLVPARFSEDAEAALAWAVDEVDRMGLKEPNDRLVGVMPPPGRPRCEQKTKLQ